MPFDILLCRSWGEKKGIHIFIMKVDKSNELAHKIHSPFIDVIKIASCFCRLVCR